MKQSLRFMIVFSCLVMFIGLVKSSQTIQAAAATCTDTSGSGTGWLPNSIPVSAGQTFTLTLNIPGETDQIGVWFIGTLYGSTSTDVYTFTKVAPADGTFSVNGVYNPNGFNVLTWTWTWSATCPTSVPNNSGTTTVTRPLFLDGRLNDEDAQETAAIYCNKEGVTVYVLGTPKWYKAFFASVDEIKQVPEHPDTNTLIKQGLGARLYRLTSGQLQVNSPDLDPAKGDYTFIFSNCF